MLSTYEHTRNAIIKAGFDPKIIESIAQELSQIKDIERVKNRFHQFSVEADKLPWPQDHDFGALVLQFFSANTVSDVKKFMLSKALDRARWCACCATAGGEGLARMQHVTELQQLLSNK